MEQTELLTKKIETLPFSKELKQLLFQQKLFTLQNLLDVPVSNWLKYEGFNYHFLKEITGYLEESKLWKHLKHED